MSARPTAAIGALLLGFGGLGLAVVPGDLETGPAPRRGGRRGPA
jgi:hypothetical protein